MISYCTKCAILEEPSKDIVKALSSDNFQEWCTNMDNCFEKLDNKTDRDITIKILESFRPDKYDGIIALPNIQKMLCETISEI